MTRAYLAFTAKGLALAQKLAAAYPGSVARCGHEAGQVHLADWTARQFAGSDALVFVGAVGIAVRAIAPHCQSKAQDPAVVVLDECGRFAVPILSGHLAVPTTLPGACRCVRCGAGDHHSHRQTVCLRWTSGQSTRTAPCWSRSASSLSAVHCWRAKRCSLHPTGPLRVHRLMGSRREMPRTLPSPSARRGMRCIWCRASACWAWAANAAPAPKRWPKLAAFCAQNRLAPQCITAAASIDLKQNEAGLLTFCKSHSWPVQFFTAEQLRAAPGSFTPSAFVQSVTGVDNVCERSAVLAADGTLVFHKYAHTGVTFALAVRPYAPDWRWQNV